MPAAVPIVATIAPGGAAVYEMYAFAMVITGPAPFGPPIVTQTPTLNSLRTSFYRKRSRAP
ncbi:hypothetical protein C4813_23820, partial [Salmonella enterica subsp. enterica serovar Rubislaw]